MAARGSGAVNADEPGAHVQRAVEAHCGCVFSSINKSVSILNPDATEGWC